MTQTHSLFTSTFGSYQNSSILSRLKWSWNFAVLTTFTTLHFTDAWEVLYLHRWVQNECETTKFMDSRSKTDL